MRAFACSRGTARLSAPRCGRGEIGSAPTRRQRHGRVERNSAAGRVGQACLWVLPVTPDGKPETGARPYLRSRFNLSQARFSRRSPSHVGWRTRRTRPGRDEVATCKHSRSHGGKSQISTGGGRFPEWGPDGRELYYLSADNKLKEAGVKLGAELVTPSMPRELFAVAVVDRGAAPSTLHPRPRRPAVSGAEAGGWVAAAGGGCQPRLEARLSESLGVRQPLFPRRAPQLSACLFPRPER